VNPQETLVAREKQQALKEQFRSWVFADPERCERLVRRYNDQFNAVDCGRSTVQGSLCRGFPRCTRFIGTRRTPSGESSPAG
jgi:N12 class adenine-specific DNA methylase